MTGNHTKDYLQGYLNGIVASCWVCHDCGNTYESSTEYCPNERLDQAVADLRAAKHKTREPK